MQQGHSLWVYNKTCGLMAQTSEGNFQFLFVFAYLHTVCLWPMAVSFSARTKFDRTKWKMCAGLCK